MSIPLQVFVFFMAPYRKIGSKLFYRCPSVRWYEGTSHRYTSPGTMVKVICNGQGHISGSCFGGVSVSKTHLVQFSHLLNLDQTINFEIIYPNRRQFQAFPPI